MLSLLRLRLQLRICGFDSIGPVTITLLPFPFLRFLLVSGFFGGRRGDVISLGALLGLPVSVHCRWWFCCHLWRFNIIGNAVPFIPFKLLLCRDRRDRLRKLVVVVRIYIIAAHTSESRFLPSSLPNLAAFTEDSTADESTGDIRGGDPKGVPLAPDI